MKIICQLLLFFFCAIPIAQTTYIIAGGATTLYSITDSGVVSSISSFHSSEIAKHGLEEPDTINYSGAFQPPNTYYLFYQYSSLLTYDIVSGDHQTTALQKYVSCVVTNQKTQIIYLLSLGSALPFILYTFSNGKLQQYLTLPTLFYGLIDACIMDSANNTIYWTAEYGADSMEAYVIWATDLSTNVTRRVYYSLENSPGELLIPYPDETTGQLYVCGYNTMYLAQVPANGTLNLKLVSQSLPLDNYYGVINPNTHSFVVVNTQSLWTMSLDDYTVQEIPLSSNVSGIASSTVWFQT